MLYLLYLRSGYIKKFPLIKKKVTIGRAPENDLYLNESLISQRHALISTSENHIVVEDLGTTNGIFMESTRIQKARVEINKYFRIGYINFFLKEGNAQDFVVSKKVQPVLRKISKKLTIKKEETHEAIRLLYTEPLIEMLQIGFQLEEFVDIFKTAKNIFDTTLKKGCLVLITQENSNTIIESKWKYNDKYYPYIFQILQREGVFKEAHVRGKLTNSYCFCSFPFISGSQQLLLIYLLKTDKPIALKTIEFLKDLSVEVSIIHTLIDQNKIVLAKGNRKIPEIITRNHNLLNFLTKCTKIAASDLFVIIEGETGTGKELIARFIHSKSKRSSGNFVALNCAAIPENLIEDELFGHEKGAFTDAKEQRKGKLELSSEGTLVLDEISDMPINLQKKFLRAIQEGQFYRVGGNRPIEVDLRIICLTKKNIHELVDKKIFREDLYYRLSHVTLHLMPLRERKEDIVALVNHFVKIYSINNQINIRGFSKEAIRAMEIYDWPGNVRELQNEIRKVVSLSEDFDIIGLSSLKNEIVNYFNQHKRYSKRSTENEREKIKKLLTEHKWNKTLVAKEMNISRTALYEKMKKYNIN
jgi:DNA-binding NtrC family response regulator